LKRRFLSSLEDRLRPLGFQLVSDKFYGLSFIRDTQGIRHFFDLSVKKEGKAFDVANLFVGLRFDAVEEMVAAYEDHLPFVTEKDLARRRTLGTWLGQSDDGFSRLKWAIADEATLLRTLEKVGGVLETEGLRFLEKYSCADEAMRVLNADDEEARRLTGPDDKRAKEAIAMALLTNGPTAAMEMKERKLAFLARSNKGGYTEVSKWADRLFATEGLKENTRERR
jgi:hypothetical protein